MVAPCDVEIKDAYGADAVTYAVDGVKGTLFDPRGHHPCSLVIK